MSAAVEPEPARRVAGRVVTSRVVLLAALAAGVAMIVGLFVANLEGGPGISDTPVYRLYGERLSRRRSPLP